MKHKLSDRLRRFYDYALHHNQCECDAAGEKVKRLHGQIRDMELLMADMRSQVDSMRDEIRSMFGIELVKGEHGHWVMP